ncbi:MAG: 30S ribosomal protein S4 [Candidatus Anstonellales archaeon]
MGDPRKLRKKYKAPKRLWDKARIIEQSRLKREYGLKNMRELWIAVQELRRVRREARRLLSLSEEERAIESKKVLNKLMKLGILSEKASIDDVLSLTVRDFLERRLQTFVFRKGFARTPMQARQLITHGFISISGRRTTSPNYLIKKNEENTIAYYKPINIQPPAHEEKEAPEEGAHQEMSEEKEVGS